MDSPKVSVFVASYNNSKYVIEALDSVRNQTYKNIELIIIDDCSSDNSVKLINDWIDEYCHDCKFIINEKNLGLCKVSNIFLENVTGKYMSWLASDDIMLPEKLQKQVELFESLEDNVGVVYSDAFIIDEKGERYFSKFIQWHRQFIKIPQGDIFTTLLEGNFIPAMSALFKKECFDTCGKYDENLLYEDYDTLLRISKKYKFVFSDYTSVEYRMHENNFHKKLRSFKALESDYAIFSKHIGYSEGNDLIIKRKMLETLGTMRNDYSSKLSYYVSDFSKKFNDKKSIDLAEYYGRPLIDLTIGQRVIRKIKKILKK